VHGAGNLAQQAEALAPVELKATRRTPRFLAVTNTSLDMWLYVAGLCPVRPRYESPCNILGEFPESVGKLGHSWSPHYSHAR